MLYANGIEPINKYINKRLTKVILNKVDMITLREEASKKELQIELTNSDYCYCRSCIYH